MREPHVEGLASHGGPESCVGARKGVGEALTGERTGEVSSREIKNSGVPTLLSDGEGNTRGSAMASSSWASRGRRPSACAEAPCTGTGRSHVRPHPDGDAGRIGKAQVVSR